MSKYFKSIKFNESELLTTLGGANAYKDKVYNITTDVTNVQYIDFTGNNKVFELTIQSQNAAGNTGGYNFAARYYTSYREVNQVDIVREYQYSNGGSPGLTASFWRNGTTVRFIVDGDTSGLIATVTIKTTSVVSDDYAEDTLANATTGFTQMTYREVYLNPSNGNVGIGTDNPQHPLHIYTGGATSMLLQSPENNITTVNMAEVISGSNITWGGFIEYDGNDATYSSNALNIGVYTNGTKNKILTIRNNGGIPGTYMGIGTSIPETRLAIGNHVSDDFTYVYDTNSVVITHQTPTSTTTLNDPKSVLYLTRQGTISQAYGAKAVFKLSRFENAGTSNVGSRTRLDIDLAHENFDDVNVFRIYSNGTCLFPNMANDTGRTLSITTPGGNTGLVFNTGGLSNYTRFDIYNTPNVTAGDRVFRLHFSGDVGLNIRQGGNVGIGTSAPESALHVRGNLDGTPSQGVHMGGTLDTAIEICAASVSYQSYIDFTYAGQDRRGRIIYNHPSDYMLFETASAERMRLNATGLGIGGITATQTLDVNGIAKVRSHLILHDSTDTDTSRILSYLDSTQPNASSRFMIFGKANSTNNVGIIEYRHTSDGSSLNYVGVGFWGNNNKMVVTPAGRVGINNTNPSTPLHVSGSVSISGQSYGFLNSTFPTGTASNQTGDYSIISDERVRASEFNAVSDERIKHNIQDINKDMALEKIRLIEPKMFNYIDTICKGAQPMWGFIAQQVESVLDYCVDEGIDYLPNIFSKADVSSHSEGSILTLQSGTTNVIDSTKSVDGVIKIKIIVDLNNTAQETIVKKIISDTQIQIEDNLSMNEVFVYGQQVNDFRSLNKNSVFTVSVAALQEVDRQLQDAKNTINDLQTIIAQQQTQIDMIRQHLNL